MNVPVPSKLEVIRNAMARMGRASDTEVAHVTPGDVVIPREVAQGNPRLTQAALQTIKQMGGDPARYVVGTERNSINPNTGAPEFFWKELLQVIVPAAAGSYFDMGDIGTALTAAATNKLTGGSWGEALASGAGSYIGSALTDYFAGEGNTIGGVLGGQSEMANDYISGLPEGGFMSDIANTKASYAGAGLGSLAGSMLYNTYQDYMNPKVPKLNVPGFASMSENQTSPLPAPTTQQNQPIPNSPGASDFKLSGVNYLQGVKDRDSGSTRFTKIDPDDEELNRSSRAYSWGNVLTI
jgi:hypothetical protein